MDIEDVVVIATMREEIRSQRPFVDTIEIKRQIQAAQARMVVSHEASDDGTPVNSESESDKGTLNEAVADIVAKADNYDVTKEEAKAVPFKVDSYNVAEQVAVAASEVVDIHGSDEPLVSPCIWLVNRTEPLTTHRR